MQWKRDVDVLIAGAGPVGLFAALAFAERGLRVQIIDEQPRTTARSYALALHPRSLELLEDLELAEELVEAGQRIESISFYGKGEPQAQVRFDAISGRFPFLLAIPQFALEEVLARKLASRGIEVLWNHRLAELEQGPAAASVRIERMAKVASGYGIAHSEWVIEKELGAKVPFVLGVDGHRSVVRRKLGIGFEPQAASVFFAVFEFQADGPELHEARILFDETGRVSALWPLGPGRYRFSFEIGEQDAIETRRQKSPLVVLVGDDSFAHLETAMLERLIAERAPWFQARLGEQAWSMAVRFERRLAREFGRGRVWLAGDAAHIAPPLGFWSMNLGLLEANDLADHLDGVLHRDVPLAQLDEYGLGWGRRWRELLAQPEPVRARADASAWVRAHAASLFQCLPASGTELSGLLTQLGLERVAISSQERG